ncbi:MAG: hypothetical protein JRN15_19375 [Nitrososphaerota archaeon]|nr:hypothetical protein [Nitrososphaerota archaeon]
MIGADSSKDEELPVDRRKLLKMGAIGGTATLIAGMGAGRFGSPDASASSALQISNGTTSFDDLLSALVHMGVVQPFRTVETPYVGANSSIALTNNVPSGMVAFVNESRITVGQDHAIQVEIKVDGEQILVDKDVVQARYDRPLSFLHSSSFYPIRDKIEAIVTNKTSRTKYFSWMFSGGRLVAGDWDEVTRRYFAKILQ